MADDSTMEGMVNMTTDFWEGRPVLVTGATGLLGSWLVPALMGRGARVVILLRDRVPNSWLVLSGAIDGVAAVPGDIRDGRLLERVISEYEIDTIFHLAAQAIVGVANRHPDETLDVNVRGTWTLLEAARRIGTPTRIVVASSDKAYGTQPDLPYSEDAPLWGEHPYDVSKSCADLIVRAYAKTYGLPASVTRCGNMYGGGDLHWERIVPGTIRAALHGENPVMRSDGSPRRDYVYVCDVVTAYLMQAQAMDDSGLYGEAFNFGLNRPMSAREMMQTIIALSGADVEIEVLGTAKNEIQDQYLDSSKAGEVLGWEPQIGLEEGLRQTIDWYRRYFEGQL